MIHALVLVLALSGAVRQAGQHAHPSDVDRRGDRVMGFDQDKTTHHFLLYEDGGAIDVSVKDSADKADFNAIRAHLPHIAAMFAAGDFQASMLVHETNVPGAAELATLKDRLAYRFVKTEKGGRVDIITTDAGALAAVHTFLRFQIADHHTGDPTIVRTR